MSRGLLDSTKYYRLLAARAKDRNPAGVPAGEK
jgi:hypothetical protein